MRKVWMTLAAGAALSVAAAAQAQQSPPGAAPPETDRAAQGIAPAELKPDQIRQIQ